MEERRRHAAEQEPVASRATEKKIPEDADHLIAIWNERQAKRMPMRFSPTIGAAITAAIGSCGRTAPIASPPATSIYEHAIGTAARL